MQHDNSALFLLCSSFIIDRHCEYELYKAAWGQQEDVPQKGHHFPQHALHLLLKGFYRPCAVSVDILGVFLSLRSVGRLKVALTRPARKATREAMEHDDAI